MRGSVEGLALGGIRGSSAGATGQRGEDPGRLSTGWETRCGSMWTLSFVGFFPVSQEASSSPRARSGEEVRRLAGKFSQALGGLRQRPPGSAVTQLGGD